MRGMVARVFDRDLEPGLDPPIKNSRIWPDFSHQDLPIEVPRLVGAQT